jgi:hypothetical protein
MVAALEVDRRRGRRNPQFTMLAFIDLEERVPTAHPLRTVKRLADEALIEPSPTFDTMDAEDGRPALSPVGAAPTDLAMADRLPAHAAPAQGPVQNRENSTGTRGWGEARSACHRSRSWRTTFLTRQEPLGGYMDLLSTTRGSRGSGGCRSPAGRTPSRGGSSGRRRQLASLALLGCGSWIFRRHHFIPGASMPRTWWRCGTTSGRVGQATP